MTVIIGQQAFADARHAEAERALAALRRSRAAAADALSTTRSELADEADSDRLEAIAGRIVAFLDGLEPAFDRLAAARDLATPLGPDGRRVQRSHWNRAGLALGLAESFQELLDAPALAVLIAATRLEVCG